MKLFIQVSPAFYKTLFFNKLSKKERIRVVYQEKQGRAFRSSDFLSGEKEYDNYTQTGGKIKICFDIVKLLFSTHYDELIIGGYDTIYCWIAAFLSPVKKNSIIVESTYRETKKKGVFAILKRLFFKRVKKAYVCGKSHADLVKAFGFRGIIIDIGTVGLIHLVSQPSFEKREVVKNFIFVGRLTPVKNLEWLFNRFAQHPDLSLTIIGSGEIEKELKELAPKNVTFLGAIPNKDLPDYYRSADVFILPSYYETYGLVVEEALNNGTPVLLSHMVGCQDNLVVANNVGLVFQLDDIDDFEQKLKKICDIEFYNILRYNVSKMDFEAHANRMINAFCGE